MNKVWTAIFLAVIIVTFPAISQAYTTLPADVTVSATVGVYIPPTPTPTPRREGKFSIFGYTSPHAKVSINNPGLYSDTEADDAGYFEFRNFFSQLLIEDICLVAQDLTGRTTMPVCIPPVPSQIDLSIGPIIMPPTIALNNDSFFTGDTVTVSGQTTPNTTIKLSMFTDETKTSFRALLNPIHTAYAATIPKVDIKVSNKGEFSMKLPSDDPQYYRTFAQTLLDNAISGKSVTLNFDIFPGWFIIMRFIFGFFQGLKSRWFEILLISQIIIFFFWLARRFGHPHQIASLKALAVRFHPVPMVTQHELLLQEHMLLLDELERRLIKK